MKIKILNKDWDIEFVPKESEKLGETRFPKRKIVLNLEYCDSEEEMVHVIMHELAHAFQAESCQWQNVCSNGSKSDEFDSEYIAEFFALYSGDAITLKAEILIEYYKTH